MEGFGALNRFFDRILVISLAAAADRQARLRERLAGLDWELFPGTDMRGRDLAEVERAGEYSAALARRATRQRRGLRPAEVGCALSHRGVHALMLREGWKRILVLEDDVVPRAGAMHLSAGILAQLPEDWELCYLGYERGERIRVRDRLKQAFYLPFAAAGLIHWTPREVMGLHDAPYSANLRIAGKHQCSHAYALTASAARLLLEAQQPVAYSADQLLIRACINRQLRAFVTDPKLFDQESTRDLIPSYVAPPRRG